MTTNIIEISPKLSCIWHDAAMKSVKLFSSLLEICLTEPNSKPFQNATKYLLFATELEWKKSLEELKLHRLLPLVFFCLKNYNLTDSVPQPYLTLMADEYHKHLRKNSVLLLTLDSLLKVMQERNLNPVLWKGVVLADSFYPDPGTRTMGDIDFAVPSHEMEQISAAFKSLGFEPLHDKDTEDAVYFANPMGIFCDVHHRVRLFEGKESKKLTTAIKPQYMQIESLPVLEANAMLVHLSVHLDGHRPEIGPLLSWIVDIAFVMRKWGSLLDIERIQELMPDREHFLSLLRTIRFLEVEFHQQPPECLAAAVKDVKPFTLIEVLKQRRLALWGLPYPRGWLRLAASKMGFPLQKSLPELYWSDLFSPFS